MRCSSCCAFLTSAGLVVAGLAFVADYFNWWGYRMNDGVSEGYMANLVIGLFLWAAVPIPLLMLLCSRSAHARRARRAAAEVPRKQRLPGVAMARNPLSKEKLHQDDDRPRELSSLSTPIATDAPRSSPGSLGPAAMSPLVTSPSSGNAKAAGHPGHSRGFTGDLSAKFAALTNTDSAGASHADDGRSHTLNFSMHVPVVSQASSSSTGAASASHLQPLAEATSSCSGSVGATAASGGDFGAWGRPLGSAGRNPSARHVRHPRGSHGKSQSGSSRASASPHGPELDLT